MEFQQSLRYSLISASIAILAACSSADSSNTTPAPAVPTSVTITGSVFASDVSGATVTVKKADGTTVAGPVTTNSDGSYSVDILDTDLASDLLFESTGGGFVDEETGLSANAGAMSAYIVGGTLAAGDSVHVTPGTTIHAGLVTDHGKTATEAQTAFFKAFAYTPDSSVDPVDITDPASFNADGASKHAGWCAAVLSRLTNNLMPNQPEIQFDLFAALAQDLSDGNLDGVDASGQVLIGTSGSALPADIQAQYIAAAGSFTTAEAANLEVTYTPPMMNVHGKNVFKLTFMDTSGGTPTPLDTLDPATDIQVNPMMFMADRNHATPMGGITNLGGGEYEVTAYYLMPSRMMDGTTMGTWDLEVTVNTKSVHFYPNIDMAMMSNTVRAQLKGVDDKIIDMSGLEVPRPYNLFRDNLVQQGTGNNYAFDIFIAPMEDMMSFPALVDGDTLTSGMGGTPYLVSGITVEASDDGGATWNTGVPTGTDGIWNFSDSSALTLVSGENEVRVKLMVSSEAKTTNGLTADPGVNDFATFTVTLP